MFPHRLSALEIETRPASVQDAAGITQLLPQRGDDRTPDEVARRIATSAVNPDIGILVAAMPEGLIVGCLQTTITRRLAEGIRGAIASLAVDADWHGRSIRNLRVRCNIKRVRAHRFHERLDFQRTKTQTAFDRALQPKAESTDAQ